MFALLLFAQAIAAQPSDDVLMPDQARAATTDELAGRLLPSDHPPIVWSAVHPLGLEAPSPWIRSIDLMAKPAASAEPGFCAATLFTVRFEPTVPVEPGATSPISARPIATATQTLYRLPATGSPSPKNCDGERFEFFSVSPAHAREQLALVRLFAEARQAILAGDTGIALSFEDRLADDMERSDRRNPQRSETHERFDDRITDPRAALTRLPIDDIAYVTPDEDSSSISPAADEARAGAGAGARISEITAGSAWRAEMVTRDGRVFALHVIRRIPPPF